MNILRTLLVTGLAMLTGCAIPPPAVTGDTTPIKTTVAPVTASAKPEAAEFTQLMAYVLLAKSMNAQALTEDTVRAREAFGRDKSDFARLKLALALASQSNSDDSELQSLLEPLLQDPASANPELRALAILLHHASQERKRAKEGVNLAQARLRDAQKNVESSQARVDTQRKQIEDLEKKLNAIKTIEKSLIQRADKPKN